MKRMNRLLAVLMLMVVLFALPFLASAETSSAAAPSITIVSTISGDQPNISKVNFTLTLSDDTYNGRVTSTRRFKGGVLNFTLQSGETLDIKNLPSDATFTLEMEAVNGYTSTINGEHTLETSGALQSGTHLKFDCVTETATEGPHFVDNPEDSIALVGEYVEFVAEAEGGYGKLVYQWQKKSAKATKWSKIKNADDDYYTIGYVTADMNNTTYRCLVKDDLGRTAISDTFTLTIPSASIIISNTIINEVDCYNPKPTKSMQYVLTLSDDTFSGKVGSVHFYDGIAAFNVKNGQSLVLEGLPAGATFTLQQKKVTGFGTTIDNAKGEPIASSSAKGTLTAGGSFKVNYVNTIDADPTVSDPHTVSAKYGSYAVFSVAGSGVQPIQYQWQISGDGGSTWDNISGATKRTLTRYNVRYSKPNLRFRCVCSDAFGRTVISESAQLLVYEDDQYDSNSPSTGDATPLGLLFGGAAVALVGIGMMLYLRKRRKV